MKNNGPILIVPGSPRSIFYEIFFKALKEKKFKTQIIIIGNKKDLLISSKKMCPKFKIILKKKSELKKGLVLKNLDYLSTYLIDVPKLTTKNSNNEKKNSNNYIKNCFDIAFQLILNGFASKLLNGPINKEEFLEKKFLGVTEYIAAKFKIKNFAMLIMNKHLAVSPITTHLPVKIVSKNISKKIIIKKILIINQFFKELFNKKPKIAVTGLNPHCESIHKFDEDKKIILPAIKNLKNKGINLEGPYAADTIFLKKNRKKFNVIIGMYHDQVIGPLKTLYEHDAINITAGLPFLRVSPDHGPNANMIGKNKSNPISLIRALEFLDKN
jgi:4-hydroxy-L-threonine phosphate dehydrogenase PdxA